MSVEHGPSANPYTECYHCENLGLPGELQHYPALGSDTYLCQYCYLESSEKQAERWDSEHYGG